MRRRPLRVSREAALAQGEAKGNLVAGNGLTIAYTSYNKTASITRGTGSIAFQHDPEHRRYSQTGGSGVTLYISGMGVLAERFGQLTGPQRWTKDAPDYN